MKKFITASLIMLVAAAAVGCCPCRRSGSSKNVKPFIGTTWHLIQLAGQDMQLADNTFNVTFGPDNRLSGIGSCNRFNASYDVDTVKESLKVGVIATTRMFCPDNGNEQKLFNELDQATHYEIDGSMMLLLKDGEVRAIFSAAESSLN